MKENKESSTRTRILETTWRLLESEPGHIPSMSKIAKETGLSRQAVYLHFTSRTDLLISTTQYVDEVKGLDERLSKLAQSKSIEDKLSRFVEIWGGYIPEIYGVSKALIISKETDEDAAEAWNEVMGCLRKICLEITEELFSSNQLNSEWSPETGADFLWTLLSVHNWEQLVLICRWNQKGYICHLEKAINRLLIL